MNARDTTKGILYIWRLGTGCLLTLETHFEIETLSFFREYINKTSEENMDEIM